MHISPFSLRTHRGIHSFVLSLLALLGTAQAQTTLNLTTQDLKNTAISVTAGNTYNITGSAKGASAFIDDKSGLDGDPLTTGNQPFASGGYVVQRLSGLNTTTVLNLGSAASALSEVELKANPYFLGKNQTYKPNTSLLSLTDSKSSIMVENAKVTLLPSTSVVGALTATSFYDQQGITESGGTNWLTNLAPFQFFNIGQGKDSVHSLTLKDTTLVGYATPAGYASSSMVYAERLPLSPTSALFSELISTTPRADKLDMALVFDNVQTSNFSSAVKLTGTTAANVTVKGGAQFVQHSSQGSVQTFFDFKDHKGAQPIGFTLQDSATLLQVSKGNGVAFTNSGSVAATGRFTTSVTNITGGTLQTGYGMTSGGGSGYYGVLATGQKDTTFSMTGGTLSSLVGRGVSLEQNGIPGSATLGAHFTMSGGAIQAGFTSNTSPSDNYGVLLDSNVGNTTFTMTGGDIKNAYAVTGADAIRISNNNDTTGSIVANLLGGSITANWDDPAITGTPSMPDTAALRISGNAAPATIVIGDAVSLTGPTILGARFGVLLSSNTGTVDLTMNAGWVQTRVSAVTGGSAGYNEAVEATGSTVPVTMKFYGGLITAGVDVNPATGAVNSVLTSLADGIKAGSGSNIILGTGNSADPDTRMQVIGSRYTLGIEAALSGVTSSSVLIQDGVTLKGVPLGGTTTANLIVGSGSNLVNDSITIAGGTLTGVTTGARVIDCNLGNDSLTLQRVRSTNLNLVVMGTGDDRVVLDKAFVDGMANAFAYVAGGSYTVNTNATSGVTTTATVDWIGSGIDTLRLQGAIALAESISDNSGTYRAFDNLELASGASTSVSQSLESFSLSGISCDAAGLFTKAGHSLSTGMELRNFTFSSGFTGLTSGASYWVIRVDNNTFRLASSKANATAGTAVSVSSSGSNASAVVPLEVAVNNTVVLESVSPKTIYDVSPANGTVFTEPTTGADTVPPWINAEGGTDTITLKNIIGLTPTMFAAAGTVSGTAGSNNGIFRGFEIINLEAGSVWDGNIDVNSAPLSTAGVTQVNLNGGRVINGTISLSAANDTFVFNSPTSTADVNAGSGSNTLILVGSNGFTTIDGSRLINDGVTITGSQSGVAEFLLFDNIILKNGISLTGAFSDTSGHNNILTKYGSGPITSGTANFGTGTDKVILGTSGTHSKALDLAGVSGVELVELSTTPDTDNSGTGDDTWVVDATAVTGDAAFTSIDARANQAVSPLIAGDILSVPAGQTLDGALWGTLYKNFESVTLGGGKLKAGTTLTLDAAINTISLTAGAALEGNAKLDAGAGDDVISMTASLASPVAFAAGSLIDGGAGTSDKLIVSGQLTLDSAHLANVESVIMDAEDQTWTASTNDNAYNAFYVDAGTKLDPVTGNALDNDVLDLGNKTPGTYDNQTNKIIGAAGSYRNFEQVKLSATVNDTWKIGTISGLGNASGYVDAGASTGDTLEIAAGGAYSAADLNMTPTGTYRGFENLTINSSAALSWTAAAGDPAVNSSGAGEATLIVDAAKLATLSEDMGDVAGTYQNFDSLSITGNVSITASQTLNTNSNFSLTRATPGSLTLGTGVSMTAGTSSANKVTLGNVTGLTAGDFSSNTGSSKLRAFESLRLESGSTLVGTSTGSDYLGSTVDVVAVTGSVIAPADTAAMGTLTTKSLNLSSGGTYVCEINGASVDKIATGTLTLGGTSAISVSLTSPTQVAYVIATYSSLIGSFSTSNVSGYTLVPGWKEQNQLALVENGYLAFYAWALSKNVTGLTGTSADYAADFDGDGINNQTEYANNTNPAADDVGPAITPPSAAKATIYCGSSRKVKLPDFLTNADSTMNAVVADPSGISTKTQSPVKDTELTLPADQASVTQVVTLAAVDQKGNQSTKTFDVTLSYQAASFFMQDATLVKSQGDTSVVLTVKRTGHSEATSVKLSTSNGPAVTTGAPLYDAAIAGTDYVGLTDQIVSFADGIMSVDVPITLTPGTAQAINHKRFTATLSAPAGSDLLGGAVSTVVNMMSNDKPVIASPAGGFTPLTLYRRSNSTVKLPDYLAQAVITDLHDTTGVPTKSQTPAANTDVSADTSVRLNATNSLGNAASEVSIPVTVQVRYAELAFEKELYEVDQGATEVKLKVQRIAGHGEAVKVNLSTKNGLPSLVPPIASAEAGKDYTAVSSQSVVFVAADNEEEVTLSLKALVGTVPNKQFEVYLTTDATSEETVLGARKSAIVRILATDTQKPEVKILTPAENAKVSAAKPYKITGTASDLNGISKVELFLNSSTIPLVASLDIASDGSTRNSSVPWSVEITPKDGDNTVKVKAYDLQGTASLEVVRKFSYSSRSRLTLTRVLTDTDGSVPSDAVLGCSLMMKPSVAANASVLVPKYTVSATQTCDILPNTTVTLTAVPKAGYVFKKWTWVTTKPATEVTETGRVLTFKMPAAGDVSITVEFVEPGFFGEKGQGDEFYGLMSPDTSLVTRGNDTMGFITGKLVPTTGAFTGKLTLKGVVTSFTGSFYGDNSFVFKGKTSSSTLTVGGRSLSLSYSNTAGGSITAKLTKAGKDEIKGTLKRAYYSAARQVPVERMTPRSSLVSKAPTKSNFNVALHARIQSPVMDVTKYPQGSGFGALSLGNTGLVTFAGTLADGTGFTAGSALVNETDHPFHAALGKSKDGVFSGELKVDLTSALSLEDVKAAAALWWIRPALTVKSTLPAAYESGWPAGIEVDATGMYFDKIVTVQEGLGLGSMGNAELWFHGNELVDAVKNPGGEILETSFWIFGNKLTVDKGAKFKLSINSASGTFGGSFTPTWWNGSTNKVQPAFKGVLLQQRGAKQGGGYGYFIGNKAGDASPESGKVELTEPVTP